MNWEVILWTCFTIAFLLCAMGAVLAFISARNIKKRKETLQEVHTAITPGVRVVFAGGLYGKVVKIVEDIAYIEISKGVVVEVSRYSVQGIEK